MKPFLRYLADKNSAHTQIDRHTDRQTHADDHKTLRPYGAQVTRNCAVHSLEMQIGAAVLCRRRGRAIMVKAVHCGFGDSTPRHAATYTHIAYMHTHTYTHHDKLITIPAPPYYV